MRLTVIGSADAFNSMGRSHSSYLIEGDGVGPLMIDFGATSLAALRRAGRSPVELRGLVFTHLHGDHIGGFPYLTIDGMFNEVRRAPLEIVGPVATRGGLDGVLRTTYGALAEAPKPFAVSVRELEPGMRAEIAGVVVEAFEADHMDPPDRPLCLRLSAGGKSVAFSGDTRMCDGLFAAADGADLLVAECTALTHPCGRHCAWEDWHAVLGGRSARKLGAKRVLFSHLGRAVRERALELAAEFPSADIRFAEDGMVLTP